MARKPLFLLVVVLSLLLVAAPAYTQEGPLSGKKICLDAGHGGSDPGAVYDDGTTYLEEADINLGVAYGLKSLLEGDGAEVVMPRTDDSYLENRDRYTFCNNQAATILVSMHTNSVTDQNIDGSLALYFQADDKILAQAIHDVVWPTLKESAPDPDSFNDFGLNRFASGVLLKSDMPAAMMEPLFMSNPAEAALLVTPIAGCGDCRRAQIAQAIYQGVVSYFGTAGANVPPTVSIISPDDGSPFDSGTSISFSGSASDAEDGDLTASLVWNSDLDGQIGTGGSFSVVLLSDGTHTIIAEVTDSGGDNSSDSITITVSGSSGGDFALTAAGYKVSGRQKADLEWSGATSTEVDVYRDGALLTTTANDGFYTDDIDQVGGGSYKYQLCEEGTTTCSNEATVTF